MSTLKEQLIRLGSTNPELREHLTPILDSLTKIAGMDWQTFERRLRAQVDGLIRPVEAAFGHKVTPDYALSPPSNGRFYYEASLEVRPNTGTDQRPYYKTKFLFKVVGTLGFHGGGSNLDFRSLGGSRKLERYEKGLDLDLEGHLEAVSSFISDVKRTL